MAQHNDVVRQSFTTQAKAFASNPWVRTKNEFAGWWRPRG